jgi:predicted acyltransferase
MSEPSSPQSAAAPGGGRLMSLDVFRGVTIASMILVNNAGNWNAIYEPLEHAKWNGWTFTDTIFPFFLWIVGVAIPLSVSHRLEQGQSRRELFLHALRRAVIIFGIGFFLNSFTLLMDGSLGRLGFSVWLHNYFTTVRIPGVLQRIAICYFIAMMIFLRTGFRGQVRWTVGLLVAYWLLMAFAPFPVNVHGQTRWISGVLEKGENFSAYVDNLVFNGPVIGTHVWAVSKTWDPEGTVSTIPAIATCLFGILTGHLLRSRRTGEEKTVWLTVGGALLMWLGLVLNLWLPINKSIWTSSYSVFMAGLAMLCLGVYYWFIDAKGCRTFVKPFVIYGMNAIAMFVLAGVSGRLLFVGVKDPAAPDQTIRLQAYLYHKFFAPFASPDTAPFFGFLASPENASLMWALMYVVVLYLAAWGMYRKKWFVKF